MTKTPSATKNRQDEVPVEDLLKRLVLTGADIVRIGEDAELLVGGKNYNTALISRVEGVRIPQFRAISSVAFHIVLDECKVCAALIRSMVDEAYNRIDWASPEVTKDHEFLPKFVRSVAAEIRKASEADPELQYSDYYIWSDSKDSLPTKKFVRSDAARDGNYMKNFFDIQPALNYGYLHPDPAQPWQQGYDDPGPTAVRNELKNIISFWMDKGVDGFRCDMAQSLVKGDDKQHTGTMRLWHELRSWFEAKYPEGILISEWSQPRQSLRAGFHIDLLIHNGAGTKIYRTLVCQTDDRGTKETPCFFDYEGRGQVKAFAENYRIEYEATRELGYAAMPTCSHDIWRLNRFDRNTPEQLKTALTLFLTLPAVPILYYGEEIGMRNLEDAPVKEGSYTSRNRSSCRTPMQWDDSPNAGFSTADASRLYLPIDPSPARPTVAAEERDPQSILNYVKGLIALRRQTPALGTQGAWRFVSDIEQPYPMVYARELDGQKYLVALNPSKRSATARFASEGAAAEAVYGTGDGAKYTSKNGLSTLKMKPVSAVILKITE